MGYSQFFDLVFLSFSLSPFLILFVSLSLALSVSFFLSFFQTYSTLLFPSRWSLYSHSLSLLDKQSLAIVLPKTSLIIYAIYRQLVFLLKHLSIFVFNTFLMPSPVLFYLSLSFSFWITFSLFLSESRAENISKRATSFSILPRVANNLCRRHC